MIARDYLNELYRDYLNNYLTVTKFAEHHGLTETEAREILELAMFVSLSSHPEN